jgi:hypothetical protein
LLDAIDGAKQRHVMGMTIMRALKQLFRRRPFLGSLAVAVTLCLIGILLPPAWSLLIGGLVVLLMAILVSFWIPSIFDRLLRSFFNRYPLIGKAIGFTLVAALVASAISIIYRAWAYGTVHGRDHVLTFSADPIAFTLWVGGTCSF